MFYEKEIAANIRKAMDIAGDPSRLRPHVKTHKTREIVAMKMSLGISKFKCATIAEAEMVAQAGAKDVMLAYPVIGPNIERFVMLIRNYPSTTFEATVDNEAVAEKLADAALARSSRAEVLIDIDPGLHRTGVSIGEAATNLYKKICSLRGLLPGGIHCYDGHNHQSDPAERNRAGTDCYNEVMAFRAQLVEAKLPVPRVVMGGTPTFSVYASFPEVELSPGTCFLQDWSYLTKFPDLAFSPAALLLTRVISVNDNFSTFTLDLGYKAISADPQGVRGVILNIDDSEALFQNEEHWVFRKTKGALPGVGDEAYVLPTHICPTTALHFGAHVVGDDRLSHRIWEITARNRKISI
ncbi:MAG: D-TA family PLP-dependent enzyme [Deltaproteobacteria bacterium]|nr:D-TA family PLP-dependent enzyme [Deltaproteobacteria bacterium]